MKKRILGTGGFVLILVVVMLIWTGWQRSNAFGAVNTNSTVVVASYASWESNAVTVSQLVSESDLVVRARVVREPTTRVLKHELPVWDENNNIVGSTVSEILFSDTSFEIIETYVGKEGLNIMVMQTGGINPEASDRVEQVVDDPLYKLNEEYILFLVDISGDKIQAPNSELYRIVNPYGRYEIDGENVFSYGQKLESFELADNIFDLETQIQQAVNEQGK